MTHHPHSVKATSPKPSKNLDTSPLASTITPPAKTPSQRFGGMRCFSNSRVTTLYVPCWRAFSIPSYMRWQAASTGEVGVGPHLAPTHSSSGSLDGEAGEFLGNF